jgi:hypothetical protein
VGLNAPDGHVGFVVLRCQAWRGSRGSIHIILMVHSMLTRSPFVSSRMEPLQFNVCGMQDQASHLTSSSSIPEHAGSFDYTQLDVEHTYNQVSETSLPIIYFADLSVHIDNID